MAKCPVCGASLDWRDLIEQMLTLENAEDIFKDREEFLGKLKEFTFKCPVCGEEFLGKYLPMDEAEKVFELLNDFKGSIDWDNRKVRIRLNQLLALDKMLEEWDRRVKNVGHK
ncbi:hypothetical protein [Pyrococcus abyssi]|uniref:Uncharacterized protein n=1 Tax=Pyrococcus abyssi (strain GE5 / Orsay) TaxID=272844 RepID=Q9UYJ7_PYRAB|nr:hypothetical protein [Pyrococcus abyssi]CAB50415.1 Hypothetical protein PAB1367 [Pyrococcus abyssi GE5]CCE70964.1 TPA: hypothetical protein PAB1367 [Pyrococcus abyssi GE5]